MYFTWIASAALMAAAIGRADSFGALLLTTTAWLVMLAAFCFVAYMSRESRLPPRWLPVRVHLATGDTLDAVARRRWRRDEHGNVCYRVTQLDGSRLPDINSDAVRCYEVPILPGITYTFNRQTASHQRGSPNGD